MSWLDDISVPSVIDVTLITFAIYGILLWLRRTRRTVLILTGILIVALSYLLAVWFDLVLTTAVLRGFFAVFLVAPLSGWVAALFNQRRERLAAETRAFLLLRSHRRMVDELKRKRTQLYDQISELVKLYQEAHPQQS